MKCYQCKPTLEGISARRFTAGGATLPPLGKVHEGAEWGEVPAERDTDVRERKPIGVGRQMKGTTSAGPRVVSGQWPPDRKG
jgi:hypothetical protein